MLTIKTQIHIKKNTFLIIKIIINLNYFLNLLSTEIKIITIV